MMHPNDLAPRSSAPISVIVAIVACGLIALLIWGSMFVIEPTEMAGVRRFGSITTKEPLGPGFYFKLPVIDQVDRLGVSLDVLRLNDLTVYTIDNQWVRISVGMTYLIPRESVFRLLYQVGRAGNFGIRENVEPIIADRAMRIFAKRNTIKISEERDVIANEIRELVGAQLQALFGLKVVDLQLAKIEYSPTFVASVEAAVKAKNDAVAAENTVTRVRYEADQARVRAQGAADAAAIAAEGEKRAAIAHAEGEAAALRTVGQAQADSLKARGEAFAAHPGVVDVLIADKWNGAPPATVLSSQGAVPFFDLNRAAKTGGR